MAFRGRIDTSIEQDHYHRRCFPLHEAKAACMNEQLNACCNLLVFIDYMYFVSRLIGFNHCTLLLSRA